MLNLQIFISTISGTEVIFTLAILLSAVLFYYGYKKEFYEIFFTSVTAMCITFSLKYILKIPRPEHMLILEDGYRFPSGHATMAGVVSALIIYFTHKHIKNKVLSYSLHLFAILWLILVSYSRLYLQVHYLIDVVAGGLIGIVTTLIIIRVFMHFHYYK
jgi:undecaprenyl-diphosphatase